MEMGNKSPSFLQKYHVLSMMAIFLILTTGAWTEYDLKKSASVVEQPPIPGLDGTIIDDLSTQFALRGPEKYWHEESLGYESHFWWTKNNRLGIENAAKWQIAVLEPGLYELYVYIPFSHATTKAASYTVLHNGTSDHIVVNQSSNRNSWYNLGEFLLDGSGNEYIELVDETGEAETAYEIAFDAVGYSLVEPEWEEKITGALWERIRPWLDEKTAVFQEKFKEWLDEQKGKLLQQLADSLKNWIDQQCASLSVATLFPVIAFVLWLRQRRKPSDADQSSKHERD
jgi:hypothetical protein